MLLILAVLGVIIGAEECRPPPLTPPGLDYFCAGGVCITVCDNDLEVPLDGQAEFDCADYQTLPFPTKCGTPCEPPQTQGNVVQTCTSTRCDYTCPSGYFLTGPERRYCNQNGEWGYETPVCSTIELTCERIGNGVLGACTDANQYKSICDFSCKEGAELEGVQRAECIYKNGVYVWSETLPVCTGDDVPAPTADPNPAPTSDSKPDDSKPTLEPTPAPTATPPECDMPIQWLCNKTNMIIAGCTGGALFVIIVVIIVICCCIKKRNDTDKGGAAFFDENPTLQKSLNADTDHIIPPSSYSEGQTMGHGIASNSFYRRPPQQQRTQYAHQHDISSPKRGYGPYRSVPLGDPNRSHEFADEEDLPFINDPSNNDNLMDTSQHYAGSSRGGQMAQNGHYDYGNRQQPQMTTFFAS